MKAVIPAAGFGTRFLPATKAQPKEMLPVYDKPTIQYVIEEAVASGIDDILIVTGRNKRSIEDHFDKSFELEQTLQSAGKDDRLRQVRAITDLADICYVRQKEQKGLGDAIYCAKKHVGVLLGYGSFRIGKVKDTLPFQHLDIKKVLETVVNDNSFQGVFRFAVTHYLIVIRYLASGPLLYLGIFSGQIITLGI